MSSIYSAIYLQHGGAGEPMRTESVPFRRRAHRESCFKRGPIRSYWQVKAANRWRWIMCPSEGQAYVVVDRRRVPVSFDFAPEVV